MTNNILFLTLPLATWALTYLIHSTILCSAVLFLTCIPYKPSVLMMERLWKVALVGGLLTATFQATVWNAPLSFGVGRVSPQTAFETVAHVPALNVLAEAEHGTGTVIDSVQNNAPRVPRGTVMLLAFWFGGTAFMTLRYALHKRRLSALLSNRYDLEGHPIATQLTYLRNKAAFSRPVRLTCCPRLASPVALCGNEICLPIRALTCLTVEQRESMLAHELAHLVRRDPEWLRLFTLLGILLPFQPLNSFARGRWQETAEYLCDDWAAAQSNALSLARCLVEVASWIKRPIDTAAVVGIVSGRSPLIHRIRRLVAGQSHQAPTHRHSFTALLPVVLLLLVACAAPSIAAPEHPLVVEEEMNSRLVDDDATTFDLEQTRLGETRKIEGRIEGALTFNEERTAVTHLSSDGYLRIREHSEGHVRHLEIHPGSDGTPEATFWIDGERQPFDRTAQVWLAELLPLVASDATHNNSPPPLLNPPRLP